MRDAELLRRLNEALRKAAKVPPEVKLQELVEEGIVDEKGRVLVHMPEPPKLKQPRKKKPKADS